MNMPDRPNVAANMVAIHRAITRGIDVTIEKSKTYAREGLDDDALRMGFLDYVRSLVQVVDAHHLSEDEVSFPQLRPKIPSAPYDTLHAEHQAIVSVLEQVSAAVDEIGAGEPPGAALSRLGEAMQRLKGFWGPHSETEERSFSMAVLADRLTPAEQEQLTGAMAAHSQQHLKKPFLALPFLLYNMPPDVRAYFAVTMPPALTQELIPGAWKDLWAPMKPFLLT